ncbi:MAG: caspase family protein [Caldilinea sp.]|nr:caspase family protein [Caldilinea sp.]
MSETFDHGYALVIGVGADLPNTVDDATGLANILRDKERCAYPDDHVHVLAGTEAARDQILATLEELAEIQDSEATVVFYFSGHGYTVMTTIGQAYYLMPYGYSVSQLSKTAISGKELIDRLAAIPAKKLLILLDCCHAGGIDQSKAPGADFSKAPLPPEAQTLMAQGSGRVVIASSQANELSYAGKPYSAFTLALIEALCGKGASRQDGYVRVADLAMYTREMVPKRTHDRQHPVLDFDKADNFVLAYYAAGDATPKELPFAEQPEIEAEPGVLAAMVINTGGGAYFGGDFYNRGGSFVGRDKIVHGDEVHGDKVMGDKTTVGDITGSTVGVIGRVEQSSVTVGIPAGDLERLFAPIMAAVQQSEPTLRPVAQQTAQELKAETGKGERADDSRVARLIDGLAGLVPGAVAAVVSAFASPILAGVAGPLTQAVLRKISGQ